MKRYFLVSYFLLCVLFSYTQGIKKVPIRDSGCSLYTYCDFTIEKQFSEDSSLVYTSECEKDGIIYGVICVKMQEPSENLDLVEKTLISYLDYLKESFKIIKSTGYGKGHRLGNNEFTRGILDYWEDSDKNNWKIKAWTNGKFIGVLYGFSAKELPESKLNVYLDSFLFPGM